MTEVINILFCDNDGRRHKAFDDHVLAFLREQLPAYQFNPYYSQSLEPEFDDKYDSELWKIGARSVKVLLEQGLRPDLVITDMDFSLTPQLGHPETGLDIIEEIAKRTHRECPWLRFILITAQAERAERGRLFDIAQYYLGGDERAKESFIELSKNDPSVNWDKVRLRTGALVLKVVRDRTHYAEVMAGLTTPELYEVVIFRKDLSDDQMRVVIRERGEGGNALGFRLGAQSVTFAALAESPRRFISEGKLVRAATKRKAAAIGDVLVRVRADQQRRILANAGIEWRDSREFCRLDDKNDLCSVAAGEAVPSGRVGYQCQEKLGALCVKKLLTREVDTREAKVSADAVRRHVNEIRSMVSASSMALRGGAAGRYEMAGQFHSGEHASGVFCGNCLVYRRRDKAGYALAASVRWIDGESDRELDEMFAKLVAGDDEKENEDAS
jgi:CheY-like chemotaxis protein